MILVAHPGTQHAHHLVSGMLARGRDVKYSTILSFGNDSRWKRYLPASMYAKRSLRNIPDHIIDRYPFLEIIPRILQPLGMNAQRVYAMRNKWFQNRISGREIRNSSAIIGFDTSSLILARKAEKEGVPFFLELTQVHSLEKTKWSNFVREKYPRWPIALLHKSEDLIRDEDEELALATIVSAPAAYVKRTYEHHTFTRNEIVINPFGADIISFRQKVSYSASRPRYIFMGAISAVKGIPILLDAWRLAKPDAELVIAGHGEWPQGVVLPPGVSITGRIPKHERETFLHSGDVFLCPSLYEGLAIVQLEAAACGLPVIGTHNSGGSEFLRDGREGFFISPGDPVALAEKISFFSQHPRECEKMGREAAVRAREYTWDSYVGRWLDVIDSHPSILK